MSDENGRGEIKTPLGSIAFSGKKTAEFISILCLCLLFLVSYVLWEHKGDAKAAQNDMGDLMREMISAQREQNCLISIPQERREVQAEFCRRVTR